MVADLSARLLGASRRLVVKIGSALLVDAERGLRREWLSGLAEDLARYHGRGVGAVVVSSGAIALGRRELGLPAGDLKLEDAQAAAAVGQIALARAYAEALGAYGVLAAQVLLTLGDTQDRRRYLNACATLGALLERGVVPVVNENDTVATDEIRYGDNDRLAARVALMAGADRLVLLSDVDGLYAADPRRNPDAPHLPVVNEITPEIEAMAGGAGPGAKGGMVTKLTAAKTATQGGAAMAIAKGYLDRPLAELEAGGRATWFLPSDSPQAARKKWISAMKPLGRVAIDAGAAAALKRGNSLLPAGVRAVEGRFERGDPIEIALAGGGALGAGLAGYSATDAAAILGRRTHEFRDILGYAGRAAMVHRDDMVIWSS